MRTIYSTSYKAEQYTCNHSMVIAVPDETGKERKFKLLQSCGNGYHDNKIEMFTKNGWVFFAEENDIEGFIHIGYTEKIDDKKSAMKKNDELMIDYIKIFYR